MGWGGGGGGGGGGVEHKEGIKHLVVCVGQIMMYVLCLRMYLLWS